MLDFLMGQTKDCGHVDTLHVFVPYFLEEDHGGQQLLCHSGPFSSGPKPACHAEHATDSYCRSNLLLLVVRVTTGPLTGPPAIAQPSFRGVLANTIFLFS